MKPEIRIAKKEELPDLLALEKLCFKEETFHKKQLGYLLLKAKSLVLVASADDKIIGSMIVLLRENIMQARIYSLNVHPSYRRMGIGRSLMDTALEFLKERGFRKFTLEAGVNNTAARNLYESKSFSVDKILRSYYKNGDDALHFTKNL
ncbi:putative N-acetyltransferase [uncultured archaeon]|nr:putative N-acetyltransferase [uncultured archaeon]